MEGELVVGSDTSFVSAHWRFETRRDREEAGGEAVFFPVTPRLTARLVSARGTFWRREVGSDRFYQQARLVLAWHEAEDASMPPVPK
jgi:hypothetical protein